jgi:hypothetical protein
MVRPFVRPQYFRRLSVGTLRNHSVLDQLETEQALHAFSTPSNHSQMPWDGHLKSSGRRVHESLIQMEDILNICCEL